MYGIKKWHHILILEIQPLNQFRRAIAWQDLVFYQPWRKYWRLEDPPASSCTLKSRPPSLHIWTSSLPFTLSCSWSFCSSPRKVSLASSEVGRGSWSICHSADSSLWEAGGGRGVGGAPGPAAKGSKSLRNAESGWEKKSSDLKFWYQRWLTHGLFRQGEHQGHSQGH